MRTFRVWQQEIWDTYTLVEANTEQEAIRKVKDGGGDQVHSEYNRMADMEAEAAPFPESQEQTQ